MDVRECRDDLRLNDSSPLFYALLEQNPDEGDGVVDKADYFRARMDFDWVLLDDFNRVVQLSGATRNKAREVLKDILSGYFRRREAPDRTQQLLETHTLSLVLNVPGLKIDFSNEMKLNVSGRVVGCEVSEKWRISEEDKNIRLVIDSAVPCDAPRVFLEEIFPDLPKNAVVYEFEGRILFNTTYGVRSSKHVFLAPVKDSITAPVAEA